MINDLLYIKKLYIMSVKFAIINLFPGIKRIWLWDKVETENQKSQSSGNFLFLTAGLKLPKSVRAILLSAEGPASEYWPPV